MSGRISAGWLFAGLCAAALATGARARVKIEPLVGEYRKVTVGRGDTLYRLARRYDVGVPNLMRLNHLRNQRVRVGQKLLLPVRHILPRFPGSGIVLNIPERRLYVFRDGRFLARHAVAVGQPSWPTAQGVFHVRNKVKNPTWNPPASMVRREGIKDEPVPPGPDNPLGDRWIGWTARGFGFHSTTAPRSIGRAASHGCVRLYPEQAEAMFRQVTVGMPIYSLYEPVKIGRWQGRFYLSVSPDVYHRGLASLSRIETLLGEAGLLPLVEPAAVRRITGEQASYPVRIAGENERIEVNGRPIETPVAPVFVGGSWVVPARAVAEALGGRLRAAGNGLIEITAGARTLTLAPGQAQATLDGRPLSLPVTPTVVEGTLLVPARGLLELFGATFEREKGQAIRFSAPLNV